MLEGSVDSCLSQRGYNRMPMVLNDDDTATWVLEELSLKQVAEFLKPCPDEWLSLARRRPR